jgi:hypothetical protein
VSIVISVRKIVAISLVLVIVVSVVIGVIVYLKNRNTAKAEEAIVNTRLIYYSSVEYYNNSGGNHHQLFPASFHRTPEQVPCGEPDVPSVSDWSSPTWQALSFTVDEPHYYSYQYDSAGVGWGASFTVSAFGNLDCDEVYSTFVRIGVMTPGGDNSGGASYYHFHDLE